jgi:MFS family permease
MFLGNLFLARDMEINQNWLTSRRIRISLFFFFYGFIFATWASRIPDIQQHLNLSEAKLGAVLLAMPVGSFITLPFSGYLTSKIGSRKVVIGASFIYGCILIGIGFSPSVPVLTLCLFLFGSSGNMMNISVNTQALELEKLYKKTIISSFHGMWSVAGLAAAFSGSYLMGKNFPVSSHFLLVSVFGIISFLLCAPYLLAEKLKKREKGPLFTKPDKAFWGLGIIAFCSMICQGAMFDWSGVYFRKVVVAEPSFIGAGYTAFMVSMTAVRFITDWFSQRLGFEKIIVVCGLCTTAGLLIAVLFPYLLPATIGMLLVGMGVSPGVPLVFSVAAKSRTLPPPVAIAAVSSIGMIGLLIGPPIIGFIAGLTSLKTSFIMLSSFGVAIIVAALTVKRPDY